MTDDDIAILTTGRLEELETLIDFLLWSGPTTMIPSHEEVGRWARILADRGPNFACLVTECVNWLNDEEHQANTGGY